MSLGRGNVFRASVAAWALSGVPSTTVALVRRGDLLEAAIAAGTLVPGRRGRPGLLAGLATHTAISAVWAPVVCAVAARRAHPALAGAAVGLGIAALDLGVIARGHPAIRALPQPPQWADHVAFGAVAGWVAGRR